jgi:hypothetical protein
MPGLNGLNGLDVLRKLHAELVIPVLILTVRREDVNNIIRLELGSTTIFHSSAIRACWKRGSAPCCDRTLSNDCFFEC